MSPPRIIPGFRSGNSESKAPAMRWGRGASRFFGGGGFSLSLGLQKLAKALK